MSDKCNLCGGCGVVAVNQKCICAYEPSSLAAMLGSALALDAQNAIKKGDPIGTYDAYAEWLASHPQGYLYLKQAISALAWQLYKTGNLPMMQKAVDEVMGAERELVNEKLKAHNDEVSHGSAEKKL